MHVCILEQKFMVTWHFANFFRTKYNLKKHFSEHLEIFAWNPLRNALSSLRYFWYIYIFTKVLTNLKGTGGHQMLISSGHINTSIIETPWLADIHTSIHWNYREYKWKSYEVPWELPSKILWWKVCYEIRFDKYSWQIVFSLLLNNTPGRSGREIIWLSRHYTGAGLAPWCIFLIAGRQSVLSTVLPDVNKGIRFTAPFLGS